MGYDLKKKNRHFVGRIAVPGGKMSILVTGGAGFIGSHTVMTLLKAGHDVVVVDNLFNGHRDSVLTDIFYEIDICDIDGISSIINDNYVDSVIHFASYIEVGVSVRDPIRFYMNNVYGSACLLEALRLTNVKNIVFSSTAAIFGNPDIVPISEGASKAPTNPYGDTKLSVERLLCDCQKAFDLNWVALRYFNAAGADPGGLLGERHHPETHLIPLAFAAASGHRPELTIFGTDYPTDDGTCIRDYVHVMDLASAHVLAIDYLKAGGVPQAFNLGTGSGYSVRQVIDTVEKITGLKVPTLDGARRPGDPVSLVAAKDHAASILKWTPKYPKLDDIISHAWEFYEKHS